MHCRTRSLLRSPLVGLALVALLPAAPVTATGQAVPGFNFRADPPAADSLSGISCVTGSFCVAVGSYADPLGGSHSLAEEWNGSTWRVMPGTLGGGLSDVSCTSTTFCMAVG